MSSYYEPEWEDDGGHVQPDERICPRCRGLGVVLIQGDEADCMDCDGWGSVLIN